MRTCKAPGCKAKFEPVYNTTQSVCGPACAIALTRAKQQKTKAKTDKAFRAETRRRKEAIKTISQLANEAQTVVNRYVRLRDAGKGCVSCSKGADWQGQWHASHYYSRGHSSFLRFNLWNIHKSCSECNSHLSGNIENYQPVLIERIGMHKYQWLSDNRSTEIKYTREYLIRLKKVFAKKCRMKEKTVDLINQ